MKFILSLAILLVLAFGACKSKKTVSRSVGVNTSRSGIKNNVDVKDTSSNEIKKEEKKNDFRVIR